MVSAEGEPYPGSELELQSALVRWSRPAPAAVGGYDLTFSPVQSCRRCERSPTYSIAALIGQAHHSAVTEALRFIEDRALFTGKAGAAYAKWTSRRWWRGVHPPGGGCR